MKRIEIYTALFVLIFALGAFGAGVSVMPIQNQNQTASNASGVDDRLKDLTVKLILTDDQQAKIRAVLEDEQQQLQAKDNSLSPQDRTSRLNRIRVSTKNKIRDLLDDDQKYKFDQMEKGDSSDQSPKQ